MELASPWLVPLLTVSGSVAIALGVTVAFLVVRRRVPRRAHLIAHVTVLRDKPRFRRALRGYRLLLAFALLTGIVASSAAVFAAARIVESTTVTPETKNRDIVLCLDVSGSMTSFNTDLLGMFDGLAHSFTGERVSLVLFNGSPLQVFPLTTDYGYIRAQLAQVRDGLKGSKRGYAYRDGTRVGKETSRIGDGVAGCILQFDQIERERSRTLVLATDYQSVGDPVVSLEEAAAIAAARGIVVHGLNPMHRDGRAASVEFQRDTEATGGLYFSTRTEADSLAAISGIVQQVVADPASVTVESPIRTVSDAPELPLWILTAAVAALLGLLWRLRL